MTPSTNNDLKLGLLLLATAALLTTASFPAFAFLLTDERPDARAVLVGIMLALSGVGGLLVIATAIYTDRRGPVPIMAIGATVTAIGGLLAIPATNAITIGAALFVAGIGSSATASLIYYAIAARNLSRHRGTILGALACIFTLRLNLASALRTDTLNLNLSLSLALAGALALTAAYLLYRLLPKLLPATPDITPAPMGVTEIWHTPHLRKTLLFVALVFITFTIVQSSTNIFLSWSLFETFDANPAMLTTILRAAAALGALAFGIASDRISLKRLLIVPPALAAPMLAIASVADGTAIDAPLLIAIHFARGGFIILPWLLLAERLPLSRFATLGAGLAFLGGLFGAMPGPMLIGYSYDLLDTDIRLPILATLALITLAIATRAPQHPFTQPTD